MKKLFKKSMALPFGEVGEKEEQASARLNSGRDI